MKILIQSLLLLFFTSFYSCSKKNELCDICINTYTQIDSSSFINNFDFALPTILITDNQELGAFSFNYQFRDDSMNVLDIPVLSFKCNIYNDKDELIDSNINIDYLIDNSSLLIWDGSFESDYYLGDFSYELKVEYPNNQFISIQGTANSRSCEFFNECIDNNSNYSELAFCRFHAYFHNTEYIHDCF